MTQPTFYKLHQNKWAWSQKAIENFRQGFLRFDSFHSLQEQVYIGVYGPTQVGKTTFILTLLGIDETMLSSLSKALRGKREYGNSATITCTIFKKTTREQFLIKWPNGQLFYCQTLEEVADVMANLRKEIERSKDYSTSECEIEIPVSYFKGNKRHMMARELSIIDLPGDNTKEKREINHVNRILSHYLRICKICIILEKANRLVRLTQLPLESVKYWNELPLQFRIVLTKSIGVSTVFEKIQSNEISNADELIGFYHEQLEESLKKGSLKTKVYPLELGDSWLQLLTTHPTLYTKVKNWFEVIYELFLEDLLATNTPKQEIYKLISLDRFLVEKRDSELAMLVSHIEEEKMELERKSNALYNLEQYTHGSYIRYKDVKDYANQLQSYKTSFSFEPLKDWNGVTFAQANVDVINANFKFQFYQLLDKYQIKVNELISLTNTINADLFITIKTSRLNKLDKDNFYIQISHGNPIYIFKKSFNHDVAMLNTSLQDFKNYLENELDKKISYLTREFQISLDIAKHDFKQLQSQKRISKLAVIEQKQVIGVLEEELKRVKEEWGNDILRSLQLHEFLMEAFIEESNELKNHFEHPDTPATERWIIYQYWIELAYHAKEIISYVAENHKPKL